MSSVKLAVYLKSNCFFSSYTPPNSSKLYFSNSDSETGLLHSSIIFDDKWEIDYSVKNGLKISAKELNKEKSLEIVDVGTTNLAFSDICSFVDNVNANFTKDKYNLNSNNGHRFCVISRYITFSGVTNAGV